MPFFMDFAKLCLSGLGFINCRINQLQKVGAILKNKLSQCFRSTCIGFNKCIDIFFYFFCIIHYSLKSDYSLFIYFFFYSLKIIGLFIIFRHSLFTIHFFQAHYSLFIIKKGHYSLIIIPHLDPHLLCSNGCFYKQFSTLSY